MSGRPASADSRQSGASLTTSPIARPRTTAGVRRPPRRPPVAPNSAPDNSRGGGRRGGRMAMSASGPMPASFSSGHNPLRTGRSMRPRTASGTAMWGQSFAATAGGSFMTQSLMDDDSNSTLPLFVDLGSPRPEDRIQTQRQMRMFEVMSRQHRTHSVQARQRVMGSNDEQFAALYTENCKQQAEMDAVERRLMAKEKARRDALVKKNNNLVAEVSVHKQQMKELELEYQTLRVEIEAALTAQMETQRKVEAIQEGVARDETEIKRHQAYTPQLRHMLKRLEFLTVDDMQSIDDAKQRIERGEHDLQALARVEQQLASTNLETHQELEKWQHMRELDRQLRGRGLHMRREILDRQKKFNQMKEDREGQREAIKAQVLRGSGLSKQSATLRRKAQARMQQSAKAGLLNKYLGKKVSFRVGSDETSVEEAAATFERMSVATGVHISTPQEALERIAQQGPREQQLTQEIETLEQAIEKAKATFLRKQTEMDAVREKYNGVGFQIARTTLDDYRRRLDVAVKNEVRQKETMLNTLELLSTVRVGVEMLDTRLSGISLAANPPLTGDKTQRRLLLITAKVRQMMDAMAARRAARQKRAQQAGGLLLADSTSQDSDDDDGDDKRSLSEAGTRVGEDGDSEKGMRTVTFANMDAMVAGAAAPQGAQGSHGRTNGHPSKQSASRDAARVSQAGGKRRGRRGQPPPQPVPPPKESSMKKRKPSQLLSQAQQNNIRVGPLSESSGSLSVTSLDIFDLNNDSEDEREYVDHHVVETGSDFSRPDTPQERQAPFRRLAEQIKGHAVRMVENAERKAKREIRRARLIEKRGNSFRGSPSPGTPTAGRPGMSPHPPGSFSGGRRRSTTGAGASRRDRFLARGASARGKSGNISPSTPSRRSRR